MIDINFIRDDVLRKKVIESERKRFRNGSFVDKAYELDKTRVKMNFELDKINQKINQLKKEIKCFYSQDRGSNESRQDLSDKVEKAEALGCEAKSLEIKIDDVKKELFSVMKRIGNIVSDDVVVSENEADNPVIKTYRSSREVVENAIPFSKLMENFTFSSVGATVVGHRGYYLVGNMAKLALALERYAIDFLDEHDYILVKPPVMLRKEVMAKTSQLSDFDDQLYKVEGDLYLVATSEQPLAALYMDDRIPHGELPKKFCGQSLCFRKEAGAHGKDNAGLFRVHQFDKIEQFVICAPEDSGKIHKEMMGICEKFYISLDISYNVVDIVSKSLNDAASSKYDLEAYFPSGNKYRELVSCSNCTDYQSRELDIMYGESKKNNKKEYVHLLNCTLCAIQRTLCCVVENYQDESGIVIPEVLRRYFGKDRIEFFSQ